VKVNVACTAAFPATRSAAATVNVTADTAPLITPHETAMLVVSYSDLTDTEFDAALASPIVQPFNVTVYTKEVREPPVTPNSMSDSKWLNGVSVVGGLENMTLGVGDIAKKPSG
jgi:hypothetical protein